MGDLAFSPVFCPPEAFLKLLYRGLLGRDPDEPGMKTYLDRLNNGVSRLDVVKGLLLSGEYAARARSDEEFLRDLYLAVLRRAPVPEADRLWEWMDYVRDRGRSAAVDAFMAGPEIVSLYEACDSFLCSSSPYGNAGIVVRDGRLILRNGTEGGHVPLEVTDENWPVLKSYLELLGLYGTVAQVELRRGR